MTLCHILPERRGKYDSLPKENVEAIMMLNKNIKVKIRSRDEYWDVFDIVAGAMWYTSLTPVHDLSNLRTSNVDRFNERKWLPTEKGKMIPHASSRWYPARTIADADYADDRAHTPKWRRQQVALVSMSMQTKQSTYA